MHACYAEFYKKFISCGFVCILLYSGTNRLYPITALAAARYIIVDCVPKPRASTTICVGGYAGDFRIPYNTQGGFSPELLTAYQAG